MSMGKTAIYPGTFDPITNGHADIVARAARLFDEVIVAVAEDPARAAVFDCGERMSMARTVLEGMQGVEVCCFSGLLVEYARSRGVNVILRGLRAVSDFEYEFQMAGMNRRLVAEVETLFLTPAEEYTFISSSLVREIAVLGGDISGFVHPAVAQRLAQLRSGAVGK